MRFGFGLLLKDDFCNDFFFLATLQSIRRFDPTLNYYCTKLLQQTNWNTCWRSKNGQPVAVKAPKNDLARTNTKNHHVGRAWERHHSKNFVPDFADIRHKWKISLYIDCRW